ncbi:zinc knuckle protein [Trichinella spiralis]|uniref:zinc knuckle protein n=1 Tax=Trichinella spiralis TaxID=6334 RepID=UPI0001EFEB18|nr:zinc knuckle protein [Trichinella spiralis]
MAAAAKALSRKLAANKARLDRLLTELEELNIDAVDDNLLGGQLELTETLFRETDALQAESEQDLEAGERNAAIEDWAKSRRRFLEARARAQGRLRPKQDNGPSCGNSGNFRQTAASARIGNLPELTLPQFDGEVLEFPTFWAQFEASVHANAELDDATKFAYLLSNTTGRARGAIDGIPITAANYPQAVGILQKRFGRPKIVARAHLLALWKAPECREMTRRGIQTLVDEITKQLRCLAAMGKDPHAGELPWSEALMPGLKEKFPRKLQRAWDLKVGSGTESEDNLENFLEFAQLQADSLSPPDEFTPEASSQGERSEVTRKDSNSAERKRQDRVTSSAAALVATVQRVCPFCEGDHDATGCQRFLDAEYSARMSMSREKGVCYKCLKSGHRARECRTGPPCGVDGCRQPHHQLLHPPATREPPRSSGPDQSHQSLLATRSTPRGGLQTIRARAYGPDGNQVVVNCLFDTGSQVSFIRKDVAKVLGLTGPHERCRFTTLGGRVGPVRRWRRVEFRLGAVESSGRPLTSTLMMALAIPQVCGKVQPVPGERSDGAPAETKTGMGRRRGTPLMIDVLIGIDYYYEFFTGRMQRRATGGPVALETLLGWVVCGRTSPGRTTEVESFPTNPENSANMLLRKNGEFDEVEILPEEDVPEKNKEARKEREHASTSGAEKCRVSLPRRSGQRGLPNAVKRTGRQLAIVERGSKVRRSEPLYHVAAERQNSGKERAKPTPETGPLRRISLPTPHSGTEVGNPATKGSRDEARKKWATKNPCRLGPEWSAEPPQARQRSPNDSRRTSRSPQGGKSPQGQATLTATMNDAAAGPRHSPIEGNAAGTLRIRGCRQRFVRRQSGKGGHGDAALAERELHQIEATQKQLVGKEMTPVSMSHSAVPRGRHVWTETPICHRHWGTLPPEAYHPPAATEQHVWIPAERKRREDPCCGQPKRRRHRCPGCRCATTSLFTRGHPRWEQVWYCLQRLMDTWWCHRRTKCHHGTLPPCWKRRSEEAGPSTNTPTWNRKENSWRVHRKPGAVAEPSTGREEVDGMCRCPPEKSGEVSDRRLTLPSGGRMFRTEQHRPSRCDLAWGWWPEVAGRTKTIPAYRRPDRYLGIGRPRPGSDRPPVQTLMDDRCVLDNGCLRHCVSCVSTKYLKKPPDGRARPKDHREFNLVKMMITCIQASVRLLNPFEVRLICIATSGTALANRHWNPKFKKLRGEKFLKVALPDYDKIREREEMSIKDLRIELKKLGIQPHRPWRERPIHISSSGMLAK